MNDKWTDGDVIESITSQFPGLLNGNEEVDGADLIMELTADLAKRETELERLNRQQHSASAPIGSLGSFWVVTRPKYSRFECTLEDICFESTPQKIGYQFIGGLKCDDVYGFYTDRETAREHAVNLLGGRK